MHSFPREAVSFRAHLDIVAACSRPHARPGALPRVPGARGVGGPPRPPGGMQATKDAQRQGAGEGASPCGRRGDVKKMHDRWFVIALLALLDPHPWAATYFRRRLLLSSPGGSGRLTVPQGAEESPHSSKGGPAQAGWARVQATEQKRHSPGNEARVSAGEQSHAKLIPRAGDVPGELVKRPSPPEQVERRADECRQNRMGLTTATWPSRSSLAGSWN